MVLSTCYFYSVMKLSFQLFLYFEFNVEWKSFNLNIILNLFLFLSGPNTYEDAAAYIQLKFESLNRYWELNCRLEIIKSLYTNQVQGRQGPPQGDLHPLHLCYWYDKHTGTITLQWWWIFYLKLYCKIYFLFLKLTT